MMMITTTRATKLFGLAGLILIGVVAACSMDSSSTLSRRPEGDDKSAGSSGSSSGSSGNAPAAPSESSLGPTDNGVILVHAAGAPSFRLCFKNELDRLPAPDAELMPDSNVVGVEIGSAVRIGPLLGSPGEVYLFNEPLIRPYFPPGQKGPSCRDLLAGPITPTLIGDIPNNLSRGVHLLVVRGCAKDSPARHYTKAECGDSYTNAGNLSVSPIELKGQFRKSPNELPSQVVHLSQPLETFRATKPLRVSFGDIATANATHSAAALNPVLGGAPADLTTPPTFDPSDVGVYAKLGFRVSIENGGNQQQTISQQSMANVQVLSSPRDVPPSYYAVASNYVLLLLGDPDPRTEDGGVETDERRRLHLLAVPVISPKPDAGTDDAGGKL